MGITSSLRWGPDPATSDGQPTPPPETLRDGTPLTSAASHSTRLPAQIKSRERVRDLAEVYTHRREVDGMLDLVPEMFPREADPGNTDRTFLEPACGSGNFLEEILRRKLAFATTRRYGSGERYEHRILRCLASVYGIDINIDNVQESRDRLRAVINSHLANDLHRGRAGVVAAVVDLVGRVSYNHVKLHVGHLLGGVGAVDKRVRVVLAPSAALKVLRGAARRAATVLERVLRSDERQVSGLGSITTSSTPRSLWIPGMS